MGESHERSEQKTQAEKLVERYEQDYADVEYCSQYAADVWDELCLELFLGLEEGEANKVREQTGQEYAPRTSMKDGVVYSYTLEDGSMIVVSKDYFGVVQ